MNELINLYRSRRKPTKASAVARQIHPLHWRQYVYHAWIRPVRQILRLLKIVIITLLTCIVQYVEWISPNLSTLATLCWQDNQNLTSWERMRHKVAGRAKQKDPNISKVCMSSEGHIYHCKSFFFFSLNSKTIYYIHPPECNATQRENPKQVENYDHLRARYP